MYYKTQHVLSPDLSKNLLNTEIHGEKWQSFQTFLSSFYMFWYLGISIQNFAPYVQSSIYEKRQIINNCSEIVKRKVKQLNN